MKKLVLAFLACTVIASAAAQDLKTFQTGFETFSSDFAAVLSYNATTGNIWSDAYIGSLPHFGVGASVGITMVPAASVEGLFTSMGVPLPDQLKEYGLPIPATAITAKLGGFFLPFDIGIKAMILPDALKSILSAAKITADYTLLGASLRYAVIKEKGLVPDVSLGASYNRLTGSIAMPLPVTPPSFTFNPGFGPDQTLSVTDPSLEMGFTTDSFDFTAQASKKILFITPYLGAGLSAGKSAVTGGLNATMTYDDGTGPVTLNAAGIAALKADLVAAGITIPEIDATGFMFSKENADPVFRMYGGFSLDLFIVYLDTMIMYVPVTKSLGANVMLRLQF